MDFQADAREIARVWTGLYDLRRGHRLPRVLLNESKRAIPALVDEIAFQPRRALAERTVSTIIPFRPEDQAAIRRGGLLLARGRAPVDLPPRFMVSAARYAIESGANQAELNKLLLARLSPGQPTGAVVTILKAA